MDLLTPVNGAAALYALLAAGHFALLVHDSLREARFLKPADKPLLNRLRKTTPVLAPEGADFWKAVLGAQASHVLGLVMFVFLIEVASGPLMAWLRWPLLAIALIYAVISWRCWFWLPTTAFGTALALLALAWIV